jgi:hypothetical protein
VDGPNPMTPESPDLLFAKVAVGVLRGLVDGPIYGNHCYLLPALDLVEPAQVVDSLRRSPKPLSCISLNHVGVVAVGVWLDEHMAHRPVDIRWRESVREFVFQRPEGRVFVRGQGDATAMTCDQVMTFLNQYRFPLAGSAFGRIGHDLAAQQLRERYAASENDSVLWFSRLLNVPPLRGFTGKE